MSVVNIKKAFLNERGYSDFNAWNKKKDHVYIGRNMSFYVPGTTKSKYANPYTVKKYGLEKCLSMYEDYILNNKELFDSLGELVGKELGCWCKPNACHGDVLLKLINEHDIQPIELKESIECVKNPETTLTIYTDGSCTGNPGDGGFGFVIYLPDGSKKSYSGFVPEKTTNNRMELLAIINTIIKVEQKYTSFNTIDIYTDSNYVKQGLVDDEGVILNGWIKGWIARNWKGVKNDDMWRKLYCLFSSSTKKYSINWVKAHSTNERNNYADKVANRGRMKKYGKK